MVAKRTLPHLKSEVWVVRVRCGPPANTQAGDRSRIERSSAEQSSPMDQITRDATIKSLKEQLELCRIESASLDNDAARRSEMAERSRAIKILLQFMERKQSSQ